MKIGAVDQNMLLDTMNMPSDLPLAAPAATSTPGTVPGGTSTP